MTLTSVKKWLQITNPHQPSSDFFVVELTQPNPGEGGVPTLPASSWADVKQWLIDNGASAAAVAKLNAPDEGHALQLGLSEDGAIVVGPVSLPLLPKRSE